MIKYSRDDLGELLVRLWRIRYDMERHGHNTLGIDNKIYNIEKYLLDIA